MYILTAFPLKVKKFPKLILYSENRTERIKKAIERKKCRKD